MIELPFENDGPNVVFGKNGNSEAFQLDGWSFPEDGFTWSLGPKSRLRLPVLDKNFDWLLALEGTPFLHPPQLSHQTIRLALDGSEIAWLRLDRRTVRIIRIAGHRLGQSAVLEFDLPESCAPSLFDDTDQRRLGVAWHRIDLTRVQAAQSPFQDQGSERLINGGDLQSEDWTRRIHVMRSVLLAGLLSGRLKAVEEELQVQVPEIPLFLHVDPELPEDISLVRCTYRSDGIWTFGFPEIWQQGTLQENTVCQMVVARLLATLPLFEAYSHSKRVPGSVILNLGDEPHARGLTFCGQSPEQWLIPDPYFMRSRGYNLLKKSLMVTSLSFDDRKPVALWRGSSTGYRDTGSLLQLPRVRLCLLAMQADASEYLDAGLTSLVQLKSNDEEVALNKLGLLREFIPPERFSEWKFHVDIDGNTNSWPGLFQKLLSGSLVFKVESGKGWRQWYYDRLIPFVNFVPIAEDLSDLVSKVKFFRYNNSHSNEIAQRGASLVLAMSYEVELERAVVVVEEAILHEAFFKDDCSYHPG